MDRLAALGTARALAMRATLIATAAALLPAPAAALVLGRLLRGAAVPIGNLADWR